MVILTKIAIIAMIVTVVVAMGAMLTAVFSEDGIESVAFGVAIRMAAIAIAFTCILGTAIAAMCMWGGSWLA